MWLTLFSGEDEGPNSPTLTMAGSAMRSRTTMSMATPLEEMRRVTFCPSGTATVGVPEMAPVVVLSTRPLGREVNAVTPVTSYPPKGKGSAAENMPASHKRSSSAK